jgi:cytochrome oxidase Cu insertion factor (SCO1/SenC/PrrC family)
MSLRQLGYHFRRRIAMQKKLQAALLAGVLAASVASPAWGQDKQTDVSSIPKVGSQAPDFKLSYFDGNDLKEVSLSQYRGKKNVVLAFFIFAFTGG